MGLKAVSTNNNGGGSGGGVASLNSLTGTLTLTSTGNTVTITPSGSTIDLEVSSGSGTVTTTGTPATGNLTKFSGATSITNGDLSGDVATSGTLTTTIQSNAVTTSKIDNAAVTYAKIQNEVAVSLLGNPTGSPAAPSEITLGSGLTFSGSTLTATGSGGTVTTTGSPANGNLTQFSGTTSITNGNLSGDVTTTNTLATTVAKIQGTVVSGTTGSGNVVFSTAPTLANPVVGTQATTDNSTKAASTAYVTTAVNNAIAGVNPAVAVQAATTLASDTSGLTYNNGVSGVGATFTGANNTALTVDGYTFTALGQRLLVKNDTQSPSGAFNGIYYVTQVQASLLPLIVTRALDYDQPSDINNTGAIPVVNGTLNATTSWVETAQITTIGTDALVYVKFSINPTTILTQGMAPAIAATSSYLNDTSGSLFPNFYSGGGGNASPVDFGIGVIASLASDKTAELRFPIPPTVPLGTMKLRVLSLANATSGSAKFTVSDAVVSAAASPSAAILTAETQSTVTWAAGDADKYKETKVALTPSAVGNAMLVVALTFNTTGFTLAANSTHIVTLIWE